MDWHGRCLHSLPELWKGNDVEGAIHGKKLSRPLDLMSQYNSTWNEWYTNSQKGGLTGDSPWGPLSNKAEKALKEKIRKDNFDERWLPVTRHPTGQKVGYLKAEYDKRPTIKANRAGTRGFRAPEVVLKCPDQTMGNLPYLMKV